MNKPLICATLWLATVFAPFAAQAQAQAACPLPLTTPSGDFADAGNGTVTHTPTGLVWKRCAEGQTWNNTTCTGPAATYTWQQAFERADAVNAGTAADVQNAGQKDWRMPNMNELNSIVELGCTPATATINLTQFPATPTAKFWSGTPFVNNIPAYAWTMHFGEADTYSANRTEAHHIRLVRGGAARTNVDGLAVAPKLSGTAPSGTWGLAYTGFTPTVSPPNAATPISFVVRKGALPPGLALNPATGAITGTPTQAGTYSFTVLATNTGGDGWFTPSITIDKQTQAAFNVSASPALIPIGGTSSLSHKGGTGDGAVTYSVVPGSACTINSTTLTGNTAGTCTVTATKAGGANYNDISTTVEVKVVQVTRTYTAPSPVGGGNITATLTVPDTDKTCGFESSRFIAAVAGASPAVPAGGWRFPRGLFEFVAANCTPGSTIHITLTYTQPLPEGTTSYWKWGPTSDNTQPHWYTLNNAQLNAARTVYSFSITEGGLGDDDLQKPRDGRIVDQGGAGVVSLPVLTASAGDGQAIFSWTPPATDGGSPVTGYTYTLTGGPGSCTPRSPLGANVTRVTCTGMSNDANYSFELIASNAGGPGPAVRASVTPRAITAVPTLNEWALMLLGLMAAGLGARALRRV